MRTGSVPKVAISHVVAMMVLWSCPAEAQTTNWWTLNANGNWSATNNWVPDSNYPDSIGAWAVLTNNVSANRIITLDTNAILGALLWGDFNRGSQMDIRGPGTTGITFDSGDGNPAVLIHGTGELPNMDFGNGSDDTDVGITVSDPQGLFIDNVQNMVFGGGTTAGRAFDGGGHDLVKGEDATIFFRRILTNVNTLTVRDGEVRIDTEGRPELLANISTVVVGVASGVIDTGANPLGVTTNTSEGTPVDRRQFPVFGIIGAATTNAPGVMTNDFQVVMHRGIFRSYNRRGDTNGAPAVYSGDFQLNGTADETIFQIESESTGAGNVVLRHVFAGEILGSGGLTKWGNGSIFLVNSNSFTGELNINRNNDRARGTFGGVQLQDNGTLSGVSAISLQRDGSLFIDNSGINLSNRVNDAATITTWGRSHIELVGNSNAPSYEALGITTVTNGRLALEFDRDDASPQDQTLALGGLTRGAGTIVGFHASDLDQGAFLTNITVTLGDGGASLAQIGGGGAAGSSNVNVAVGVFGGDGVDNGVLSLNQTPSRADEFMTVDGGRLRTLLPSEMVHLGGRSTNALTITQASAPTDANVNIDFASRRILFGRDGLTNGSNELIESRVVEGSTFNAIRLNVVQGDAGATDNGRTLMISDGVKLTSESGMLLAGRDTGSADGDATPGGNVFIRNGILDLDGTNNNREAIIQNDSGNNLFLRTTIEAGQGLTKGGQNNVYLDAPNRLGGTVSIPQNLLIVRNSGALDGANLVKVSGDGQLYLDGGNVAITNVDLLNTPQSYGKRALVSNSGHNLWGGDILIDNVDNQGLVAHDVRLGAGINNRNAVLTLTGDIGRTDKGMTSDIYFFDSPQVTTIESSGILNLMGTFGDRLVNGEAVPVAITNYPGQVRIEGGGTGNRGASENEVLRFRIESPTTNNWGQELVVNIYKPWNAAGRINAESGTIRFLGDPSIGEGDFWTTNALEVSNFANGMSGFRLSGTGNDVNYGSVMFLLTKDGQSFNAERWQVDQGNNSDNVASMGLEHFGPSNATVTIGNKWNDPDAAGDDNRITISGENASRIREFRLFAQNGYDSGTSNETAGTVNVIQSIRGNDNSVLTKVGRGTVALQGVSTNLSAAYDESNDIRRFMLLGGELVLDRRSDQDWVTGQRRTQDNAGRGILELSGGDLTHLGANGGTTEYLQSNLIVRAGDAALSVVAGTSGTTELLLGTATGASLTREAGGTVHFVEDGSSGGTANIRFGGVAAGTRVGSWATYGTNYGGGAHTWAATDGSGNIAEYGEGGYAVDTFGAANHVHLEVPTALLADDAAASLRYTNAAALDLGGFSLDVVEGGILVTPTVAGMASITNGALTSSGGELIIHNYHGAGGGFEIAAAITGAVDVTFSGTANGTVLSGANTYTGATRINGGTVVIDDQARLGAGAANLEMRGGTLATTANAFLSNRTVVLGGDGGTFHVAANTTNVLGPVVSEDNLLDPLRQNPGHGDLIKTGQGVLELSSSPSGDERSQITTVYQGVTDIREGTLRVVAQDGNLALGSNHGFHDGTIVRTGAELRLGKSAPDNTARVYNIYEWLMLEEGSQLYVERPRSNYQSPNWNGVIHFLGDATIYVPNDEFDLNENAGYLMGSGNLIKDGNATVRLMGYSPEFTGDIVIVDGWVHDYGYAGTSIPNADQIIIGLNDATNRGSLGFVVRPERNDHGTIWDVAQDIIVQGDSSDTRIGVRRADHNDEVNFLGDIDLTNFDPDGGAIRELRIWVERALDNRDATGGDEFREDYYVNFSGDITGGDKRIRTYVESQPLNWGGYTNQVDSGPGSQSPEEFDMMAFITFTGSNSGWTGMLEMGNREAGSIDPRYEGPDQDKQHFVRFGKNDGEATAAIGPSNAVILRHDATLQAFGSQVTIGSLFSDGIAANNTSDYADADPVSNAFVENGGTTAATLTVFQTSNSVFGGVIRNGTFYSRDTTNMPSATLSLVKDGPSILTLTESNYYTGTTVVRGGDLNVDGIHAGGGAYSVLGGGALGGTGLVMSSVQVFDGGALAPGSIDRFNGALYGSLTIDGNLILSNSSSLRFDLDGQDFTPGGDGLTLNDLVHVTGDLTLDGVLSITPSIAFGGPPPYNTNTDFWTLFYYEGNLTDNTLEIDGASQALVAADGLMFYIYSYDGGAVDEIRLGLMVPEPSTWALLLLGLGLVGWLARRRGR